jgi:hypothetical protein
VKNWFQAFAFKCVNLYRYSTVLGPTYGGPLSVMVPFNGGAHLAYATPEKVVGLAALPLDGDPVGLCTS